ncbi:MAG TPA: hypothetical protein VNX00_05070, partial [Herbaspirillum sp.]|nr:hypothetical protein [Herbaspirillum sp.]
TQRQRNHGHEASSPDYNFVAGLYRQIVLRQRYGELIFRAHHKCKFLLLKVNLHHENRRSAY